jgi:hypothetical protein
MSRFVIIRRSSRLLVTIAVVGLFAFAGPPTSAAEPDLDTLHATLNDSNVPDEGDPGGSGTLVMDVDSAGGEACFAIDVTLSDIVGDSPTAVDLLNWTTDATVLSMPISVDGAGHGEGCVSASGVLLEDILGHAQHYIAHVLTGGFPTGSIGGVLEYSYPLTQFEIITRICPPGIQSADQLTEEAAALCLTVVLPPDDVSGLLPGGYTILGYGGAMAFDYHVTDGKNVDQTTADAERGGGGSCNDSTMTCNVAWLPYVWEGTGAGVIDVELTDAPAGYRFGTATASTFVEPPSPLPVEIDGQVVHVDATGAETTMVNVYLFVGSDDLTSPTVTQPVVRFQVGATAGSSLPVRVSWTSADDSGTVDHYTLQLSKDGGDYLTIGGDLTASSLLTYASRGHAYRYRVQAFDAAGNPSVWAYSSTQHPRVVSDGSQAVRYRGTWHAASPGSAMGGKLHYSTDAGATARLEFRGRAIAWVAPEGLGRGSARIYIDGNYVTTISLYGPTAARVVQYSKTWSKVGNHRITVKVVGTQGHRRVDVDAFLILD